VNTHKKNTRRILLEKILPVFLLLLLFYPCKGKTIPRIKKIKRDVYTRFTDFTPLLGNSCGNIVDIEQDDYGNIWLAGTKGLAKFTGSTVRYFHNNWTPGSLPSSAIYCLELDDFGRMWFGTRNGLCFYDPENDRFRIVIGPDTVQMVSDTFFIRKILAEGDSLLWFDTQQGFLWKLDLKTFEVRKQIRHTPAAQRYYHYHALYRDRDGILWLGGRTLGPCYLNSNETKIISLPNSNFIPKTGYKLYWDVAYLFQDSLNNFWVGATDGIYLLDKTDFSFSFFLKNPSWAMCIDHKGNYWFALANGLARYSLTTGEITNFFSNEEDKGSLLGSLILDIFEDQYHQLWVASEKGVSVLKQENPGVRYLFHIPDMPETPASSAISSLAIDSSGMVWVGTQNHGLACYNPERETFQHFNVQNTRGLPTNNIRCITISPHGEIWCGLWAGVGFGKLDPDNRHFTCYTYHNKNTQEDWYNDLLFDKKENLYLGFWGGGGLTRFDYRNGRFGESLKNRFSPSFPSRLITCLETDEYGHLWMGTTSNGLHVYFPAKDSAIGFLPLLKENKARDIKKIFDIKRKSRDSVWIGAHGLFLASLHPASLTRLSLAKGYDELDVYQILPENQLLIWLLTDQGLLRYNYASHGVTDYSSIVKLTFDEDHAAAVCLHDGRFLFGGTNGLAVVNTKKVQLNPPKPAVFLTTLLVFDKIKVAQIKKNETIRLSHKENFFTIQIGSDIWSSDPAFRFYYKLEGFNKDWVALPSSEREAHFTNVPPGNYVFHVKIEDNLGNRYTNIAECSLSVIPPYWKQWWFFTLIILALFSLSYYFWWARMKSLRLSLFNSELNQKLLRLQMNPHFIFNSLSAIQNYIYTNQTHLAGNYLSDFAHLIRLILNNSRSELIPFEKELETINLYLKLQKLRFEDKFDYHIEVDPELKNGEYEIPPMLAQPFLENAIEHGLKNLDRKGQLNIHYRWFDGMIRFELEDNGIGLTAGKKHKEESKPGHESLAISICKKRLEILRNKRGGEITFLLEEIKNAAGEVKGTRVAFNIPV